MAIRYYIHGDADENLDNKYFCVICDTFEYQDHFSLFDHVNNNHNRFFVSLEKLKTANARFLKKYSRPKESENLFMNLLETKSKVSKFFLWLEKQKDRDDPIGDLATDALSDLKFPKDRNSFDSVQNYLISRRADSEAIQALVEAFNEFNKKRNYREGISLKLRFEIFKRDNYKCGICGASAKEIGVKLEVDHKVPVARGGKADPLNLWTLCFKCNRGKSTSKL